MRLTQLYQRSQVWLGRICRSSPSSVLPVILSSSLVATGLVLILKETGKTQPFELVAFDRMMQVRRDAGPDSRLLIVGITEDDIKEQWRLSPSDETLTLALRNLQQYQPRAIGVDLHRNIPNPPGWGDLLTELSADNVVVIKKIGDTPAETIHAPPGVPEANIGFNDIVLDPDGVVRRNLIFASVEDTTFYSFALRLALKYLSADGIEAQPSPTNPNDMMLGETTFLPLRPHAGGYHQADAAGYQVLLDFRSLGYGAPHVSLTELVEDQVDPALIRDKIVLIGTTATTLKDLFLTPYSSREGNHDFYISDHKLPGVAVHAQMVSQILDVSLGQRPLFQFLPEWGELLWIWGWAGLSGGLAWAVRRPLLLGLTAVSLMGALLSISYGGFLAYYWLPVVTPALASLGTLGIVVTYRGQQAHLQQHMVMTLLGQSTSPEIATALWESRDRLLKGGKLPGELVTATMLFSDIKNFSGRAESLRPSDLMDWLNEYFDEMTAAVKANHGIVNKFTGDGLLAVFGVPVPGDTVAEDAKYAVRCALAMRAGLARLNQYWRERGDIQANIQMRVGIFTGPVVVGSLGSKERLEYAVIGDSVNTAARLESCAKEQQVDDCRILIAYETLKLLDGEFEVEPWGSMPLQGKRQTVDVFRVVGPGKANAAGEIFLFGHPSEPQIKNS
ncbi:MAG: adenylate/guanylate cyclase domain-containing protein [Synechococcales bacterium]|nr:adenylate/guanylate cyclase domain-containing protein [Synechococcales bacterium]